MGVLIDVGLHVIELYIKFNVNHVVDLCRRVLFCIPSLVIFCYYSCIFYECPRVAVVDTGFIERQ